MNSKTLVVTSVRFLIHFVARIMMHLMERRVSYVAVSAVIEEVDADLVKDG